MIDLLNQALVIGFSVGWALLGLQILDPPNGPPNLLEKAVASVLFVESFFVLFVGLTRPPYGKSLGFIGLGIGLLVLNTWVSRKQSRSNGARP